MTLLDMREVMYSDSPHAQKIRAFALKNAMNKGFVEERTVYKVSWEDDEYGAIFSILCATEAGAEDEVRDDPPEKIEIIAHTPKLNLIHGWREDEVREGLEFAIVEWARGLPGIDGVYWNEMLDPDCLSAPRAGMFSVQDLGLTLDPEMPDDSDALLQVKEIQWLKNLRHQEIVSDYLSF